MLYIDDREGSKELVDPLSRMGVPIRVARLEFGDLSFVGNGPEGPLPIGIEYKTSSDLLACIGDGRLLGHQLPGMLNSYEVVYLLLEDALSANSEGGIHKWNLKRGRWDQHPSSFKYTNLAGWLHTLNLCYGVRILTSSNLLTSCVTVASIYEWWQKEYRSHGTSFVVHTPGFVKPLLRPTRIMRVAAQFPGVGSEKLPLLEEKFSSVREMVNAEPSVWRSIDGIGAKTAEKIEQFLTTKEGS